MPAMTTRRACVSGPQTTRLSSVGNPKSNLGSAYGVGSPTNPSLHCPIGGVAGRALHHAGDFPGRGGPSKRGLCTGLGGPFCGPCWARGGPCWAFPVSMLSVYHTLAGRVGFSCAAMFAVGASLACLFCRILAGHLSGTNANPKRATLHPVHIMT